MDNNLDNLRRFIDSIKTIGFWSRLFGWRKVRNQLIDASADLQKLVSNNHMLTEGASKSESLINGLSKDLQLRNEAIIKKDSEIEKSGLKVQELNDKVSNLSTHLSSTNTQVKGQEAKINQLNSDYSLLSERNAQLLTENKRLNERSATMTQTISDLTDRKNELDIELAGMKRDLQNMQTELSEVKKQNTQLMKDEEFRKQQHSNSLATLTKIQERVQAQRLSEIEDKNAKEVERIRNLKATWNRHQENAGNLIKAICQKHTIQYINKVPFKGDPDNTVMICDEYIVFDAKSPGGDDLNNFPNYLKDQAEKARKYACQDAVKSDIFFVVPSNTLDFLNTFVYRHGDHNVYVISVDALEPVILGLKKIEEYEFAEQLSPDDRDNICRVLGKFAHLSKRRIQVDSFFAKQFIELAYKCETDLPKDILDSVIEFEKAEKLNPPQEKRVKAIPIGELDKENKRLTREAESKGILIEHENISNSLNGLPLYRETEA